jgi:TonB family protein
MTPTLALWFALLPAPAAQPVIPPPPAAAQASADTQTVTAPAIPCSPDAAGKYQVGHGVLPPKLIHSIDPQYSKEAKKRKFTGISVISLRVETDGNPTEIQIVQSAADKADKKNQAAALSLDENALAAVRQYRFQPATCQGTAVPVTIHVEVNFRIF